MLTEHRTETEQREYPCRLHCGTRGIKYIDRDEHELHCPAIRAPCVSECGVWPLFDMQEYHECVECTRRQLRVVRGVYDGTGLQCDEDSVHVMMGRVKALQDAYGSAAVPGRGVFEPDSATRSKGLPPDGRRSSFAVAKDR